MTDGRSGVALPVPRNSASLIWGEHDSDGRLRSFRFKELKILGRKTTTHEGITMKLINSVLRPHIRSEYLIGINAQNTSRWRIHLMAVLKRLMSLAWDSTSLVGNKFVQNLSPLPNETCSSTLRCEMRQDEECSVGLTVEPRIRVFGSGGMCV